MERAMRGRHPKGPEAVEQLPGSDLAKQRLRAVLETIGDQRRVQEACAALGIGEARFRQLRQEALQGALAALEPQPAGRPAHAPSPTDATSQALQARVAELEAELRAAQTRTEIALILPQPAPPEPAAKKASGRSRSRQARPRPAPRRTKR
jgi:Helix-turn-helix domain